MIKALLFDAYGTLFDFRFVFGRPANPPISGGKGIGGSWPNFSP